MTKFQIKRILKKVKAPDIDIPELAPLPRKRASLKPVLATAALALVIVGASVIGIKGNIFKGEQPLPPADIDTPDTPDTPTPPEDDVKIIYADSVDVSGSMGSIKKGNLKINDSLENEMNAEENKDCKFAVYVIVRGIKSNLHEIVYEQDEKYRLLYNIADEVTNVWNSLSAVTKSAYYLELFKTDSENMQFFKEKYIEDLNEFLKLRKDLAFAMEEYEKKYKNDADSLYFNEDELETINKVKALTEEDFRNREFIEEFLKSTEDFNSARRESGFRYRLILYKLSFGHLVTDKVVKDFKSCGVEIKAISAENTQKLLGEPFSPEFYEATLSKEEIYLLEGTDYSVFVTGRSKELAPIDFSADL